MDDENKQYMWDGNNDMGRSLTELRNLRGLTLDQLGELADYTPTRLAAIERGSLPHGIHNLARIVEVLGGRLAIVTEESKDDPHCQFIEFEE